MSKLNVNIDRGCKTCGAFDWDGCITNEQMKE